MTYTFDTSIVSDLYKDAYGFRPDQYWMKNFLNASDKRKQQMWDNLLVDLENEINREREEQASAAADLEASIRRNLEIGAADRATAIRWIIESLGLDEYDLRYGGSYICFRLGLPYNMQTEFDPICKAMLKKMETV